MRRPLILGPLPRDHIGRDSPGRTGKADQRRLARQLTGKVAHRLIDRVQRLVDIAHGPQLVKIRLCGDRGQARPFAGDKPQISAKCLRYKQNIRKEDRRIKPVTTDRLQGDLGRQLGVVAQRQEIPRLRPRRLILGQIASGLPHHPDRRHRQRLSGQ